MESLTQLETARQRAIAAAGPSFCFAQSVNNVDDQCQTLRGGAQRHVAATRQLGLTRSALFLPLFGCSGRCSGGLPSIGNVIAYYVLARAAALAGRLDFFFMMQDCPKAQHVLQLLPKVAAAPTVGGAPNYAEAATVACAGYPGMLAHKTGSWTAYLPRFREDLRAGLSAWASRTRFPPSDAPYDDVAIHFRCGDVMKRQHPEYGILPLEAIAALVPAGRATTVGLVTMNFHRSCSTCNGWLAGAPGRRQHNCPGSQWLALCSCACAAVADELVLGLQRLRPLARVAVRYTDGPLGAWARLLFARVATVCMPSTFCLWPTLAAVGRGHFVASPVWPNASALSAGLPGFSVISEPPFVSYDSLPRGFRKSGKRKRRPRFDGNCTTTPEVARAWVRERLWPAGLQPPGAS